MNTQIQTKCIIQSYIYIPSSAVQEYVLDVHNDDPIMKKTVVVVTTLRDREITFDAQRGKLQVLE